MSKRIPVFQRAGYMLVIVGLVLMVLVQAVEYVAYTQMPPINSYEQMRFVTIAALMNSLPIALTLTGAPIAVLSIFFPREEVNRGSKRSRGGPPT